MRIIAGMAAGLLLVSAASQAKVSPEEAAKLGVSGTELTPVGAIRAGDGEHVPEWTPYTPHGDKMIREATWVEHRYKDEQPLFVVTKANMAQYADMLSEGHKQLLQRYDSYKIKVYPSHRDAAWPKDIYEATIKNATTAHLEGGDPDKQAAVGKFKQGGAAFDMTFKRIAATPGMTLVQTWQGTLVAGPQKFDFQIWITLGVIFEISYNLFLQ